MKEDQNVRNQINELYNKFFNSGSNKIFRGQSDHDWKIESSFWRHIKKYQRNKYVSITYFDKYIDLFLIKSRGKISEFQKLSTYDFSKLADNEKEYVLAVGQHYGLKTPLIDFSFSQFIALFFACFEYIDEHDGAVYIIDKNKLETPYKKNGISFQEELKILKPFHNISRLINQEGLFIKLPLSQTLEDWIKKNKDSELDVYEKIKIDKNLKKMILSDLDKMNINFVTLFPDADGVAKYSNNSLISYYNLTN